MKNQSLIVRFVLAINFMICVGSFAFAQRAKFTEYQCSVCSKTIANALGALPPKSCPHCGARFDGMKTEGGGTVHFGSPPASQPVSNFVILGVLCGLFSLAALAGGITLIVYLVKQSKKKSKRRAIRRRDDDDFEEDDDQEDDRRPARRKR